MDPFHQSSSTRKRCVSARPATPETESPTKKPKLAPSTSSDSSSPEDRSNTPQDLQDLHQVSRTADPERDEPNALVSRAELLAAESSLQATRQRHFKADLLAAYDLPMWNTYWDVSTGTYAQRAQCRAVHLVDRKFGDDFMAAAFGAECAGGLYSARNGLVLNSVVCDALAAGALAIVPDMRTNPSRSEVAAWKRSNPREYKFRLTRPEMAPHTQRACGGGGATVASLHDQRLRFLNYERPRARYLYFLFHVTVLRRSRGYTDNVRLLLELVRINREKFDARFWGVGVGDADAMDGVLPAFVAEVRRITGHEHGDTVAVRHLLEVLDGPGVDEDGSNSDEHFGEEFEDEEDEDSPVDSNSDSDSDSDMFMDRNERFHTNQGFWRI
ncbi:hypothetical protein F4781DRAFT_331004 [Annulohypoxylon bovei var. microspora]|nr:hypothetical protein F4781DRAFT_331004 [Annulohypoxylon bovei var. microspora]